MEKEDEEKAREDFEELVKKQKIGIKEEQKLMSDITQLLGLIKKKPELYGLVERMIAFGEKHNWNMSGNKFLLKRTKENT